MWNCRCSSWACEHCLMISTCHQILTWGWAPRWLRPGYLKDYVKCHVLPSWRSCAGREGKEPHEKERSPMLVRKGRRPVKRIALGSWSELINHFNVMLREAFTCSIIWGNLLTPPHICHQKGERTSFSLSNTNLVLIRLKLMYTPGLNCLCCCCFHGGSWDASSM